MKVETATPDKPEIAILARKLKVSLGDAFLEWFKLYRWADKVTGPGFIRGLSGCEADALAGCRAGTCDALASAEVNWINQGPDGLTFVNWERHNGKSAKARALDANRKRPKAQEFRELSGCEPEKNRDRREEDEREILSSKGDRKTIGSASAERGDTRSAARRPSSRSPIDSGEGGQEEPFDLGTVDWGQVLPMAEAAAKRVPPRTTDDRRAWLRFAVLADVRFGESWLIDAAEAVLHAKETKRTRQAHFVGVLKTKAAEQHGVDEAMFVAMLRRIEIPSDIWKSGVLEIRK